MSAQEFRTNPIDRRRLSEPSRSQYSPSDRLTAISKVKAYRERNNYIENRPRSTTTQKPGTGGLSLGRYTQGQRQAEQSYEKERMAEIASPDSFDYNDLPTGESSLTNRSDRKAVGSNKERSDGTYFG